MVSRKLGEELKIIIKKDYKKDLKIEEVFQIAENLVEYFDLLAKIYHRIKIQNDDDDDNKNN